MAALGDRPDEERVLEAFVDFEREVSVVAARGADGAFAHWGVIGNTHRNHILDLSVSPCHVPADVASEAVDDRPRDPGSSWTSWACCASNSSSAAAASCWLMNWPPARTTAAT